MAGQRAATRKVAQLWQLPLLLLSLGLFGYAAYVFIDPKPGLTVDQKIDQAREFLKVGRPTAAVGQLNQILASEKLLKANEARIHLMLAESFESSLQRDKSLDLPANRAHIIEQTRIALEQGIKPDAEIYRRLGDSYAAIEKTSESLEAYRRAIALDPNRALTLQRKVIDFQLLQTDTGPAEASLNEYLKDARLADAERSWAQGKKAQLLVDKGNFIEARTLLTDALRADADPIAQGQYHYGLGYCAWKLGDNKEAERLLRVARDQLTVAHPLSADAAYTLGRIRQDAGDVKEAISFYQDVLVSHPDSLVAPLSRLGRGVCRVQLSQDDAGLTDLHDLTGEITAKSSRKRLTPQTIVGLQAAGAELVKHSNIEGALELLAYEQQLNPKPEADFYERLAQVYEKRAVQLNAITSKEAANAPDHVRHVQQVRETRTKAGDAWVAHAREVTLSSDKLQGVSLWKGIELYDQAGDMQHAIAALELFVAERPTDGATPEALLKLGKIYQAAGMFDKAIASYQKNQTRYPQTFAASQCGVSMAQCYVAKGAEFYPSAEKALLRVIDDNPVIAPSANEFREGLFELAQLYYRTNRYEEAVNRLEELTDRYPDDRRMGQLVFLMADAYRKSAGLLDKPVKESASASADPSAAAGAAAAQAEALAAKKERLEKAGTLYERVIELYRKKAPVVELDTLYLKLSHFYRADCLYDLGKYEEAIKLYDSAAMKYQNDPSALAAYVQIVNSYCALGKVKEAKTANERAKWLLKKIPPESFQNGQFAMPKEYWEQWLKWTSESGLW